MSEPLRDTLIGDRYRLLGVIGQGGMGVVYQAEDTRLNDRLCAVKLLLGTSTDPDEVARFERELRIISRLRSAHVVQVLDTGVLDDGRRFIVMELLEGLPLSALLKRTGPLEPSRAVRLAKGVLAALAEAHEHGVVHRDLKPANVFITRTRTGEEQVKVLDFGIAKETSAAHHDEDLTGASMLIGTPKYMAPEQFLKQQTDGRTDLYAAGLLLYQMLSGEPPFTGESPVPATLANMPPEFRVGWLHINQPPTPLPVEPELWGVLLRLLGKKPDTRFASAEVAIEALLDYDRSGGSSVGASDFREPPPIQENSSTTGLPVFGETLNAPLPTHAPRRGSPWLWVTIVLLLLGGGGAVAWLHRSAPPIEEPVAAGRSVAEGICAVELVSDPPGAAVHQAGQVLGMTPMTVERPCREVWRVDLEKGGYLPESVALRSRQPESVRRVALRSAVAPPPVVVEAPPPEPEPEAEVAAAPPTPPVAPRAGGAAVKTRPAPTPAKRDARKPEPARPTPSTPRPKPATDAPLPF